MASDLGKDAHCCRSGKAWDGEPKGKEAKIAGLDAYISEPPQPSDKAVLLIPDIHGWDFKNTRLVADSFAAAGYLTVLPDFFHGDKFPQPATPESWQAWFGRNPLSTDPENRTFKDLLAVLSELRSQRGAKAIGVQGFCWGGYWAVHLTSLSDSPVQTAIIAHGSRLEQPMIERIAKPTLFVCPEIDSQIPADFRAAIEKELQTKPFPTRVDLYPGMEHGFTVRPALKGDDSDEALLKASDEARQKSVAWFNEHLKA